MMSFLDIFKKHLSGRKKATPEPSYDQAPAKENDEAAVEEMVDWGLVLPTPESSCVRELRYDAPGRTLTVTFHGGRSYDYPNIDRETARQFAEAASKGRYYNAEIKRGGKGLFG